MRAAGNRGSQSEAPIPAVPAGTEAHLGAATLSKHRLGDGDPGLG